MSCCKKEENICDMIDGLGKVVQEIDYSKKISKEIAKFKKEIEAKTNKAIDEVKTEFMMVLKKFNRLKWVIGEYKWMPVGSKMPEGWVKVDLSDGLTLVQGSKEGSSRGALKHHFHYLENGAGAWGTDEGGVLYFTNRPVANDGVIQGEDLVFKKSDSKDRWIHKTSVTGNCDRNLAAGKYAELWQFKGVESKEKCIEYCLKKYIDEYLESDNKCCCA